MNANSTGGNSPAAPGEGQRAAGYVRSTMWPELTKQAVGVFVAKAIAAVVFLAVLVWGAVELWLRDQVIRVVAADFASEQSRLGNEVRNLLVTELQGAQNELVAAFDGRISQALDAAFSSRIGAVSTGRFQLNARSEKQTVFVYLPPEHEAQLYTRATGIRSGEKVELISHKEIEPITINNVVKRYNVRLFKDDRDDPQAEVVRSISIPGTEMEGKMQHLISITFELRRESDNHSELLSAVGLDYLILIWPPISAGEM